MTKIKNTKKGMAKKTLSISLAVAMLATSNVPVWAAEDLFTDGDVAVEAFTSEEAPAAEEVVEAPVVEDVEEVVDAQAEGSTYDVAWKTDDKAFETAPEWGTEYTYKVKVTDGKNNVSDLKWRWTDVDGNETEETELIDKEYTFGTPDADGYVTLPTFNFTNKAYIGKSLRIQIYEGSKTNMGWNTLSDVLTVQKKKVTASIDVSALEDGNRTVHYTGSQINTVPEISVSDAGWTFYDKDGKVISVADYTDDMTFENFHSISGDPVNAKEVSETNVTSEGDIVSPYYTGKVQVTFIIWRKDVKDASEAVKVELPKYVYQYTGADIKVAKEDVKLTEKLTGKELVNTDKVVYIPHDFLVGKDATATADSSKKATVNHTGNLLNYYASNWETKGYDYVKPVTSVQIVKRNLADTENTKVAISTVSQEALGDGKTISEQGLKSNLSITDYDGKDITETLKDEIKIEFEGGKSSIEVHDGETITAYVKGTSANFTDDVVKVEFKVVDHDLANAHFNADKLNAFWKDVADKKLDVYSGKQLTLGLTKDNFAEKLGALYAHDGTILSSDTQYDMDVQFGENVNAGKNAGQIIINGKGDWAGTQLVLKFDIKQRTADKLNVPEKVLFNNAYFEADEYALETSVTATAGTDTLTVPAEDYKVEYTFVDENGNKAENKVGNYVQTVVTLTNKKGNFNFTTFTKKTLIVNKAITEADIQLEKTEYTYNAAKVMPEYKVVVNGVVLEKGKDYTEVVTQNDKVGEANLTITGKGEYDTTTSVTKKFTIVAANVSDIKVAAKLNADKKSEVVYDGTQWVGNKATNKLDFTIEGNTINFGKDEFIVTYPTSTLANINAGDATVTLKPAKNNKNFVGEETFTFTISPATLTGGTLTAFDKNGTKVDLSKAAFDYDGTAHKFATVKYAADSNVVKDEMKLTENDYEIIYRDNIVGKAEGSTATDWNDVKERKGSIIVVAKGNYVGGADDYECADKSVVKSVAKTENFIIKAIDLNIADATVENGEYAEGKNVDPVVKVSYKGKELVKDVDYTLVFKKDADRTNVTNGKTLEVRITGKGGYYGYIDKWFAWGIDKFDLENAEVIVSGTNEAPVIKVLNNGIVVDAKEYTVDTTTEEGKAILTAATDSKHYTGSKKVDIKVALEKPATPMLEKVTVNGNKATAVLSGECEGAIGYDYVISTDKDCITNKDYDKVNKNILKTTTDFTYVQQGTYYAYCHAWTRDENGQKVFSDWSNAYPFVVGAITPSTPVITSVKASGSTVTVKYTAAENAAGYDVVLGTAVKTVAGEKRPVEYGTLVKKNIKDGVVTATFKNVPKGTYYAGLHAFNRTNPENNTKVFSPWSNTKKVTVK